MELELTSALDITPEDLTHLFNRSFAGYLIEVDFDCGTLFERLRIDGVGLGLSRVLHRDGETAGLALVARRGWSRRIAAMGIVPELRGQGAGGWMMQRLITEAQMDGDRWMELEVIEQNTAAVRLYDGCGFERLRRLVGYVCTRPRPRSAELEELDTREVGRLVSLHGDEDLPWQISGESIAHYGAPSRSFRFEGAFATVSDPLQDKVALRALVVLPEHRGRGHATRLVQGLMERYPKRTWSVPVVTPEELAGPLFERLGFVRQKLTQLQMRLAL